MQHSVKRGAVFCLDRQTIAPVSHSNDGILQHRTMTVEENAKLFIDFVTSKECQTEQSGNWGRRPVRSDMEVGEGMAKLEDIPLVDYDFDWAANEKEAIIEHFNDIMVD